MRAGISSDTESQEEAHYTEPILLIVYRTRKYHVSRDTLMTWLFYVIILI